MPIQHFHRTISATAVSLVWLGSAACTPPKTPMDEPMLTDTVWQLQQIQFNDGTLLTPDNPANYAVEFMADGQLGVQADCNRVLGEFTEDGSSLAITLGPSTLAACGPESIDTEFTQSLSNAALYFFQADDLFIDLAFDSGTMQFSPAPEDLALVGTVWELEQIQYNDGTLLMADPPENYTVEFMDDGSAAIQADCNQGRGDFTTDDSSIDLTVGAITRVACPPGSISNEFLQGLNDSAIYFFQDGKLFMDIKYGTGTMRFRAAQ
jgi:heat shock protein HslJ